MTIKVYSNYEKLIEQHPNLKENAEKSKALRIYLENSNLLKVYPKNEDFTIAYPDKKKIKNLRLEAEQKKDTLQRELERWKKKNNAAKNEETILNIKKLANKKYWEHLAKKTTDSDYKKDFENARMKEHFAAHPKWNKMFEMFVDNPEYRKRLVETINTSIVYSKDKTLGKSTENMKEYVLKTSTEKIQQLEKRIQQTQDYVWSLKTLNSLVK